MIIHFLELKKVKELKIMIIEKERKLYTRKCPNCGKDIKWYHGYKPDRCPSCNVIKWDKPADECKLFNIQEKYLKTKDKKYLSEMYKVLLPYARRTVLKMLKGRISYDEDKLEAKVQDTVTVFLSYYLRKPSYQITDSFGALLTMGANQQLHNKRIKDIDKNEMSYDIPLKNGEDKTFLDEMKSESIPLDIEKTSLENDLMNFTDKMFVSIFKNNDLSTAVQGMYLLHFYLNNTKASFFDKYFNSFGTDKKQILEKEKLALFNYIKDLDNAGGILD